MFLEYDWTFNCYRARFGQSFIDVRGARYWDTMADARFWLAQAGLKVGRKTDSRTWAIDLIVPVAA